MKKILMILGMVGCLSLLICGCSNPLQETVTSLQIENNNLVYDVKLLTKQVEEAHSKINELENGASNLISQLRSAAEKEDYEAIERYSKQIHESYNGSQEDNEAQEQLKISKEKLRIADEKRISDEEKSIQDKVREVIRVSKVYPSKPNSAGGIDLYINWVNNSDKEIKYITFEVEPYNAVGDVVKCEIRENSTFYGKNTGPYPKGTGLDSSRYWECAWYNNTVKTVKLTGIDIEYMDGEMKYLSEEKVTFAQY